MPEPIVDSVLRQRPAFTTTHDDDGIEVLDAALGRAGHLAQRLGV